MENRLSLGLGSISGERLRKFGLAPSTRCSKIRNLDLAFDLAGLGNSAIEYRVATLDGIELAIGKERDGQLQSCSWMAIAVPIVNRWIINLRWKLWICGSCR